MLVFHSVALYKVAFFALVFRGFLVALWCHSSGWCHFKFTYVQNTKISTYVYHWVWDIHKNSALKLSLEKILISTDHTWWAVIEKAVVFIDLGVCMWYKVTVFFSCPVQALLFAQLCTLWVLAQNPPLRFSWQELNCPPSSITPGACQGLAEQAGGSQCCPVGQDGAGQGRWQAGDAQGTGSCAFGAFGGSEVKRGSLQSAGQGRCLRPDAAGLFLLLPPVHPPPVSGGNQLWKVYWNFSENE